MASPFLAEIRFVSFNFAPRGWAMCNGQLLPIAQNQALFSLLGTTYGGNGQTNFGLPNLQGRVPIHDGVGSNLGVSGGAEAVTLATNQIPQHTHAAKARTMAGAAAELPTGNFPGKLDTVAQYRTASNNVLMNAGMIGNVGGSAHSNMQPYLALNAIIALQGIFPSRN